MIGGVFFPDDSDLVDASAGVSAPFLLESGLVDASAGVSDLFLLSCCSFMLDSGPVDVSTGISASFLFCSGSIFHELPRLPNQDVSLQVICQWNDFSLFSVYQKQMGLSNYERNETMKLKQKRDKMEPRKSQVCSKLFIFIMAPLELHLHFWVKLKQIILS